MKKLFGLDNNLLLLELYILEQSPSDLIAPPSQKKFGGGYEQG